MGRTSPPASLHICSVNIRGLGKTSKKKLLDEQLDKIKWDITAIQETKSTGTSRELLHSGVILYHHSENPFHGTGFCVAPHMVNDVKCFCPLSSRLSYLDIAVKSKTLRIFSAYAPTSTATDQEYSGFLDSITTELTKCTGKILPIVLGDFNGKIGLTENDETSTGIFGYGSRNGRGQQIVDWMEYNQLRCFNTFYKKRSTRQWTWKSPNGRTLNMIDFAIGRRTLLIEDVSVLNKVQVDSDHRMLRVALSIHFKRRLAPKPKMTSTTSRALFQYAIGEEQAHHDGTVTGMYDDLRMRLLTAHEIATTFRKQPPFMSTNTLNLLEQRSRLQSDTTPRGHIEFVAISRAARASRKNDIIVRRERLLADAIRKGRRTRKAISHGNTRTDGIVCLRDHNKVMFYDTPGIAKIIQKFYNDLYSDNSSTQDSIHYNPPLPLLITEVERATKKMKLGTSPGTDRVPPETLNWSSSSTATDLLILFNMILKTGQLPNDLLVSETKLLYKKGDPADIANYRPITLLNSIYKTFTRCLLNRIEHLLDNNLDETQCGFRSNYGTSDNLHIMRQLIERTHEYRMPLFACYIDLRKAFDSILHSSIWKCMKEVGAEQGIISILQRIYEDSESWIKVNTTHVPIKIQRGVRQGDVISPRLFTAVLNMALRKIDWGTTGIKINGVYLSHLLFADDAVLFARNKRTLVKMIRDFEAACATVGLSINTEKCDYQNNVGDITPLRIGKIDLPPKENVTYLGAIITMPMDWNREISRRISSGWSAFNEFRDILKKPSFPMRHKRHLFNTVILPRLIYGCESWAINTTTQDRLRVCQRKMERAMLNYKIKDRVPSTSLRSTTRLFDAVDTYLKRKSIYCSRIANMSSERWSLRLTVWRPFNRLRAPGRPAPRWRDILNTAAITYGRTLARGRTRQKPIRPEQFLRCSQDRQMWRDIWDHQNIQI